MSISDAEFCEGEIISIRVLPQVLDFAVVLVDTHHTIETRNTKGKTIDLDPIPISEDLFRYIFYQNKSTFGINPSAANSADALSLISFKQRVNGAPFVLLEEVIQNIETTMNCNRSMFSQRSTVKLYAELGKLHSLLDLHLKQTTTSLDWNELRTVAQSMCVRTHEDPAAIRVVNLALTVLILVPGIPHLTVRFHYNAPINLL